MFTVIPNRTQQTHWLWSSHSRGNSVRGMWCDTHSCSWWPEVKTCSGTSAGVIWTSWLQIQTNKMATFILLTIPSCYKNISQKHGATKDTPAVTPSYKRDGLQGQSRRPTGQQPGRQMRVQCSTSQVTDTCERSTSLSATQTRSVWSEYLTLRRDDITPTLVWIIKWNYTSVKIHLCQSHACTSRRSRITPHYTQWKQHDGHSSCSFLHLPFVWQFTNPFLQERAAQLQLLQFLARSEIHFQSGSQIIVWSNCSSEAAGRTIGGSRWKVESDNNTTVS